MTITPWLSPTLAKYMFRLLTMRHTRAVEPEGNGEGGRGREREVGRSREGGGEIHERTQSGALELDLSNYPWNVASHEMG